ncbi:MAG: hypothetical protein CMF74_12270 [Maricaulis sp.]|nr:hypothetical protein [Maricaulis sp.]
MAGSACAPIQGSVAMSVRRIVLVSALLAAAPALSGCLVIGGAAFVTGTAVGVAGDTLQLAGNVGEGVVRAAIPGDGDDDDDDRREDDRDRRRD